MDQPGKVANPARGQLNRENNIPLSPCMPENLVSRDGFSRPVPRQPAHLHTQAESGAYLRDSSRVPRRRPLMKPPYAIGSVPSLSGHAIAYRSRSLPRVRRHRASKPQGSSERVLPWQITMDQLIFASLSHTHCWYEVGMLKVPAVTTCWVALLESTMMALPTPNVVGLSFCSMVWLQARWSKTYNYFHSSGDLSLLTDALHESVNVDTEPRDLCVFLGHQQLVMITPDSASQRLVLFFAHLSHTHNT